MPDENAPEPKPAWPHHHRTAAKLFRIAGGIFAIGSVASLILAFAGPVIDGVPPPNYSSLRFAIIFLSLCVVFIAVGQIWARKAQQEDEASSGGSAKQ